MQAVPHRGVVVARDRQIRILLHLLLLLQLLPGGLFGLLSQSPGRMLLLAYREPSRVLAMPFEEEKEPNLVYSSILLDICPDGMTFAVVTQDQPDLFVCLPPMKLLHGNLSVLTDTLLQTVHRSTVTLQSGPFLHGVQSSTLDNRCKACP